MTGDRSRRARDVMGDRRADRAVLPLQRTLALELSKLRSEALAADRNERAGEIEQIIRLMETRRSADGAIPNEQTRRRSDGKFAPVPGTPIPIPFPSWNHLRALQRAAEIAADEGHVPRSSLLHDPRPGFRHGFRHGRTGNRSDDGADDRLVGDRPSSDSASAGGTGRSQAAIRADGPKSKPLRRRIRDVVATDSESVPVADAIDAVDSLAIDEDSIGSPEKTRRKRPAAWLVSLVVHGVILSLLTGIGIQVHRPKDQIALTGSAADPGERSIETFQLETSEPVDEPTESAPAEVEYEISPVGEVASAEFATAATPTPAPPMTMSPLTSGAKVDSLTSDSEAKVAFLGLEGGGNHFVYLVDSSKSMGDAFPSARRALIESIEALTPQQRFYVIFFDRDPDYMRISDPTANEPRSVYATVANKASLRRWAAQISMDNGRAPYDPIRFALELKPDVIFLLSDGEFPQKFEKLVDQANRVENLFGDRLPISIIHTISYHSESGERRMRRIADQHGGQYRHVPKP